AAAERAPFLEVSVFEAPFGECVAGPIVGALQVGRAGEARADDVGQVAERLHGLRVVETLVADAIDDLAADAGGVGRRRLGGGDIDGAKKTTGEDRRTA